MHPIPLTWFWRSLRGWYKKAGRVLPWRFTRDPYTIWVSEIMLQQTQVATVLPYYHRFLAAFPTVQALSAAPLDAVLKIWEGMGYYARARSLHRAAQILMDQYQGCVPMSYKALSALPGIGRSTAGAILNIAFLQRYPICDGNVKRILIRYFGSPDLKPSGVDDKLWSLAEKILPPSQVNLFTQAIMDLGATVCLPKAPQCTYCPVSAGCKTYKTNSLPTRSVSKKIPHYDYVAAVIKNENKVLIKKRPEKGLLGGLWEFPGGRMKPGDDRREKIQQEIGQTVNMTPTGRVFKQTFSHFKMTLRLVMGTVNYFDAVPPLKWVSINHLLDYPFPSTHRKIAVSLSKHE